MRSRRRRPDHVDLAQTQRDRAGENPQNWGEQSMLLCATFQPHVALGPELPVRSPVSVLSLSTSEISPTFRCSPDVASIAAFWCRRYAGELSRRRNPVIKAFLSNLRRSSAGAIDLLMPLLSGDKEGLQEIVSTTAIPARWLDGPTVCHHRFSPVLPCYGLVPALRHPRRWARPVKNPH